MWTVKESRVCLIDLPNEILAMRTECWLLEESRNEAMVLDVKDVLLFQCTFSVSVSNIDFILLLLRHIIVSHFDSFSLLLCTGVRVFLGLFFVWTDSSFVFFFVFSANEEVIARWQSRIVNVLHTVKSTANVVSQISKFNFPHLHIRMHTHSLWVPSVQSLCRLQNFDSDFL